MTIIDIIEKQIKEAKAYYPRHYQLKLWKAPTAEKFENELGEGCYQITKGSPKLEGTIGEHWSPGWPQIIKKYQFIDGSTITPETVPSGKWIPIQTPVDEESRRASSITWAMPAYIISDKPFEVNGRIINPNTAMLCMADNNGLPSPELGCWPVNKQVFFNTYIPY